MAKDVKIRITAKDATKRAIDSAKSNIKQLGSIASSVGKRIGGVFRGIGRGITRGVAVATAGIIAFGVASVKAASDAEETRAKFNAVFKETAGEARKWAESFATSVNRSSIAVEGMMSAVQDLFVPLGFTRKEAAAFSKSVSTMAVDLASFNNKADADVLRDLQSALVGNSETVRKYGIILTEATIAEEAVALGMAKTTKEVSNQAKVMARLSLIQKGSTDAQGDAIRTANSTANVFKRLNAAVYDLRVEVGKQLIAGLGLGKNFSELADNTRKFISSLRETGAIENFANAAREKLGPVLETLKELFDTDTRTEAISKITTAGGKFAEQAVDFLLEKATPVGLKIGEAIAIGIEDAVRDKGKRDKALVEGGVKRGEVSKIESKLPFFANIATGGAFEEKLRAGEQVAELKAIKEELIKLRQPEGG
jgi:hypothetical protein